MSETVGSPTSTEILEHTSVFAHLVPGNPAAKIAFSLVIDRIIQDSDWIPYARQYIFYEPSRGDTSSSSQQSENESSEAELNSKTRWTGGYALDFKQLPSNPHRGWRLGSGRLRTGHEDVEFLLTTRSRHDGVNSQHCRLNFNFDSYLLLITAEINRQVLLFGYGTNVLRGTSMAVPSRSSSIELGNLRYELKYTDIPQEVYRSYINEIKEVFGTGSAEPPLYVDPTPADADYHISGYIIKEPLALGGSCVVCYGFDSTTGALVAVKRVTKHRGNMESLDNEVAILKKLREHGERRFLCTLVDTVSRRSFDAPPNLIDDMYLVYTPLAPESLATVVQSDCPMLIRLKLFTELLQAIEYIHGIGLMHRDIKPANMAVVCREPPHAMLIDFGHATWNSMSRNHHRGTYGYLAPELLALKKNGHGPAYDNKVDLWAFGLCGYQLFCFKKFWWPSDNSKLTKIKTELEEATQKDQELLPVLEIIIQMLVMDPRERISASAALMRPCFERHLNADLEGRAPVLGELKRVRDD